MENGGYLFAAYAAIWLLLFGFVLTLVRRQTHIKREIDAIKLKQKEDE